MTVTFSSGCKTNSNPAFLMAHPTGNQNVRNALLSLVERDMLAEFWTTIAWDPKSPWNGLLTPTFRNQLGRRVFAESPKKFLKCIPWMEMVRLGARSSPMAEILSGGERPFSVIGVYRHFDARVSRRVREINVNAVYAYEGGAVQTFRAAKDLGITTFYDLPSGHWYWERDILNDEAERNPEFSSVIPKLRDSERHLREKDEELNLADRIIVASQHVRGTLAGVVPDDKIRVVPYGAPPVRIRPERRLQSDGPLRVLFVGNLNQRKGIVYLLKAVEMLKTNVELTLIGSRFAANSTIDAACARWRWYETIPHGRVLEVMMESDVLVLPSISEGFGLVVTEALACGLPVIVTPNVGAGDLLCNGREGFVVPVCSAEAIGQKLNDLHSDREMLTNMSENAQMTAGRLSWDIYRKNWAEAVRVVPWH